MAKWDYTSTVSFLFQQLNFLFLIGKHIGLFKKTVNITPSSLFLNPYPYTYSPSLVSFLFLPVPLFFPLSFFQPPSHSSFYSTLLIPTTKRPPGLRILCISLGAASRSNQCQHVPTFTNKRNQISQSCALRHQYSQICALRNYSNCTACELISQCLVERFDSNIVQA